MSVANLKDRVAIITGSGRGLGEAIALRLAKEGAHIAVNDINEDDARQTAAKVEEFGCKTMISTHDVSKHDAAAEFVNQVKETLGGVDILVNNAGITRDAMLHKLSEEKWDQVINVNLKGVFNMGQAAAKVMMEQKRGNIINLSSLAWRGNVGQTNYSAAKAGVVGMTRTWGVELSRHGIRCNAIAPGFIDSVLTRQVPEDVMKMFIKKIPAGRIGQPEDIANLAQFLASDESSYITGQVIEIDGGLGVGIG